MNESVLGEEEKIHIVTRRLFAQDARRHFVGVVISASGKLVVTDQKGYTLELTEFGPGS
ncbi:MAG: hypothetical protein JW746_09635 [Candidatus Krumholzibacteriota bacterium]|nr:hypothetical protein [Candidatus Krumholzibacteriota bacterium]